MPLLSPVSLATLAHGPRAPLASRVVTLWCRVALSSGRWISTQHNPIEPSHQPLALRPFHAPFMQNIFVSRIPDTAIESLDVAGLGAIQTFMSLDVIV